jgi:Tol biopolymer transport system component
MGEVYRARDSRLDRDVAIKVLPDAMTRDADRIARFEREAKVLASLNHPNIGAIHGFETAEARKFLVLEYVEGETLAHRLKAGALPVDEALAVSKQMAEALEAAHEKGIVHRDLKPGNVMIRPDGAVKVLDFGLARAMTDDSTSVAGISDSPTVTTPVRAYSPTIPGVIMGTAGYMSPEQARGKAIDKRSDIFSFGCVLYEMLTGRQPFTGETVTDSLGAILHREPDWTLLPSITPPRIRELLSTCLAKDRKQRLHDMGDARLALERAAQNDPWVSPAASGRSPREIVAWLVAVLGVAAAVSGWALRASGPVAAEQRVIRFTIPAPPGTKLNPESVNAVVSPDGRRVAFIAAEPGRPERLWVRDFDSVTSRVLEGTDKASMPFWSPDSRSIAFFANGLLCRIASEGGPVQRITDAPGGRGGDWSETGVILFAPFANGPLHVVPQSGGASSAATEVDQKIGETGHRFPQFLPGGRKFLYAPQGPRSDRAWQEHTFIGALDSKESHEVCVADSRATFAPGGWLLIERSGTLYAQRFDPNTGAASGEEVVTGIEPGGQTNFGGHFAVSSARAGVVACPIDGQAKVNCVEVGSGGQVIRTLSAKPGDFQYLHASPTGGFLAMIAAPIKNSSELQLIDLTRDGVWSRLVDEPRVAGCAWSRDGQWVFYSTDRKSRDIFRCGVTGAGKPELVHETGNLWASVKDVSADGRVVIFTMLDPKNGRDLWILDTTSKTTLALAGGPANEFDARLSPDDMLVAIASDESGRPELYVQNFPEARVRVRVSFSGLTVADAGSPSAAALRWTQDGSSIMFLDADGRTIRSAVISDKPVLHAAKPEPLMQLPADLSQVDIAPDGKSVFGVIPAEGQAPCSISVTLNWTEQLRSQTRAVAKP